MLEAYVRPIYQKYLITPISKQFAKLCSPNQISLLAAFFGLLIMPALFFHQKILAIMLLALSGYLDTVDGSVAREMGRTTNFGCALDITCDRIVEIAIVFGLCSYAADQRALWCLGMLASILLCVTTFLIVGIFTPQATTTNKSFHYSPGLIERAEAFIIFLLMILIPSWFTGLALIFCLTVCYTALYRLYEFWRNDDRILS